MNVSGLGDPAVHKVCNTVGGHAGCVWQASGYILPAKIGLGAAAKAAAGG